MIFLLKFSKKIRSLTTTRGICDTAETTDASVREVLGALEGLEGATTLGDFERYPVGYPLVN